MKKYHFLLHQQTWNKLESYLYNIKNGQTPGKYLAANLGGWDLSTISKPRFLEALVRTKKPLIFAENWVYGDGRDWNQQELSILGDISVAMPVTVFDNGLHHHPSVHQIPFKAHLVFTPGALLKNSRNQKPTDFEEVTYGGKIDPAGFNRLYERRLLPAFSYINNAAGQMGKSAFITIPGLGCGQFAGIFHHQLGPFLQGAIHNLLTTYGNTFSHIKGVYFDPFQECANERHKIHGIHFLVRPLKKENFDKPQLCQPGHYQEGGDDFSNCKLFSLVAWDHVSWPGNDFYAGNRNTDDGVKAAATDAMRVITGVRGNYDHHNYKYQPPEPYLTWGEVVNEREIQLGVENNFLIYPS